MPGNQQKLKTNDAICTPSFPTQGREEEQLRTAPLGSVPVYPNLSS